VPEMSLITLISYVSFSSVWHLFLIGYLVAGMLYGLVISFFTIKKFLRV